MKRQISIGLLYSRTGSYRLISLACRSGVLAAMAEIEGDPALDLRFHAVERDPGGNLDRYAPLCDEILRQSPARHIFGCVTSSSRKEVIPTLDRAGGTLWYAAPYEGFEASDRVVYTHACPNQHLLPLLGWCFARFGRRAYLTGSNYIWGWEMNRLAREVITDAGGAVLGERYLPVGETDPTRLIDEIRATRPGFILNNLIGDSQYAFLRAYAALGREDPHFRPETCPILSCNLTECELAEIGADAEGLIAAGPHFDAEGGSGCTARSSFEAAAHASVWMLARLLADRPGAESLPISAMLDESAADRAGIDRRTHHRSLPVLIAQVRNGGFRLLHRSVPVAGDPYLAQGRAIPFHPQQLRAVP
ncbi:transporter substrate-binding protein [Paracoccus ravus]|uniref:transporter substrate-binding protein n=1 Tax=Paracoccus ravus TaxID=2447760 RepID=UPI00106F0924|nr:transporter substrate-binding protein [Paracoccus ravus]